MPTPRVALAHLPTPVEPMDRLGAALGFDPGELWVKRDDCTGLAGGGNKARKLEYLCADALAQGCDTLVTGGGAQSNHARMTAAAANKLGLGCTIVLAADEEVPAGNVVLDVVLGAEIVWAGPLGYRATEAAIEGAYARLAAAGRRPYLMPIGGATVVGALGYVDAADELVAQLPDVDLVVVAGGSGGTHAGLVAGLGDHAKVLGVNVGARRDLAEAVSLKAAEVADLRGRPSPSGTVQVDDARVGAGYGMATQDGGDALEMTARLEGLILDPVYTAKAMAGLIAARRDGRIAPGQRVVFLHTGGMPALFATGHRALSESPGSPPAPPSSPS
ncbi:MAG: D-cysteine desulfhydrase family protein [Actinobacteria bacterium]|nr:D-cysteine desulfhydrase family protein [Actinomycetota bacterium]